MTNPKILFCASEASPYAKTGGLADVIGALPGALRQLGCDVRVLMPLYRSTRAQLESSLSLVAENISVTVGIHDFHVHFWEATTPSGAPIYFVEKEEFFDRSYLYGSPVRGDYEDNAERFVAFCRAVPALCSQLDWFPDIFHLHDWQTALMASYHYFHWRYDSNFTQAGTVFTIHNLGYQGIFPGDYFNLMHLPPAAYSLSGIEYWGQCNFLKAGLIYSDFITTVSPRYSVEIQKPELGYGLEGILQERRDALAGILNGVDYEEWDPRTDPLIPANFSGTDLSGKKICKEELLLEFGFPEEGKSRPLLSMISRLASQKGFDLLLEILDEIMELPVSLLILGTGDAEIENKLQEMADRHPAKLKMIFQFNEGLAHRIEAGSDIFLMPSHYEPCGLNQMYSLRYGAIPIVHATGGLDDSVEDVVRFPQTGTGLKFYSYDAADFLAAIRRGLDLYENGDRWRELINRAMEQDFSWGRSAQEYLRIYRSVVDKKVRLRNLGVA
jgi:starch synthase